MKEILIFAGTTEGRVLSERLAASGVAHTICVATEYGGIVLKPHPLVTIHQGRMDTAEIYSFVQNGHFAAVVDATHPYAEIVSQNIQSAVKYTEIPYLRMRRPTGTDICYEKIAYFDTNEACAKALEKTEGSVLLTVGSKEIAKYCISEDLKRRLFVRVLPAVESLELCKAQGICGRQVLAMQGPFSAEMNEAIIRQYGITCMVTKASGKAGGYSEKLEAAKRTHIPVYVIGHSSDKGNVSGVVDSFDEGNSFAEVCDALALICGKDIVKQDQFEIILAGIGMGSRNNLTNEVSDAIDAADILLGAERMIAPYTAKIEKKPFFSASQIIPYLKEKQNLYNFVMQTRKVVILFSGDSGFYSGSQAVYNALQAEINAGNLHASVRILPGISSIAYLASCIGESYHDAEICSIHGKTLNNLVRRIERKHKLFLLLSGAEDLRQLGKLLVDAGLVDCRIAAGYQLSYPEQKIMMLTPGECLQVSDKGLYTCFIKNPYVKSLQITHGMADKVFIRDKVPMTKEEIREVSICKLRLTPDAVVYDIGSGTGSIAIEIAGLSDDVQVYALERKEEAINLIKKNKEKLHLQNIDVIQAEAPEGLSCLPVPTHVFIGGSGGKMDEILKVLYQKNPHMRIVINAISMETICEIKEVLDQYPITEEDIVQVQVSRAGKAGNYHLMMADNPVWICAFNFKSEVEYQKIK